MYADTPGSLGRRTVPVTVGQTISEQAKAIVCLTEGNLTVIAVDNSDSEAVSFVAVPAGFIPPFRVRKVTAATAAVVAIL
jgi:hypothetical protein